jgi:hypothetical protein
MIRRQKRNKAMNATLAITKAAVVGLFDSLSYPNPDDSGPWGPIGPVIRQALLAAMRPALPPVAGAFPDPWQRIGWALLNPQPLPPKAAQVPIPWISAVAARSVIDYAVTLGRSADAAVSDEQGDQAMKAAQMAIHEFVDDLCPPPRFPRKWPRPWPWPWQLDADFVADPVDVLVAGVQFQKAADVSRGGPLAADFERAADVLFETGFQRLAERGMTAQVSGSAASAAE